MTQTFDITLVGNGISQVIILRSTTKGFFLSKNGIIDYNSMNPWIVIGIEQGRFDVDGIVNRT
jgi:hypothetical protein